MGVYAGEGGCPSSVCMCVLGNICHKLPEVLYRLCLLPHIFFALPSFKLGTNALALLKFLDVFSHVLCFVFTLYFFVVFCLCGPDNNPLCVASILHQSISKCMARMPTFMLFVACLPSE